MSAYNTLIVNSTCNNCNEETQLRIQFRFGDTWDYEYRINDEIKWGGNDVGRKEVRKVVLDGVSEPCKRCIMAVNYLIFIEKNTIKSFEVNVGQFDFDLSDDYYLIIE